MGRRRRPSALPTRRELAAVLDVHPQTLVKWEQAGMPVAARGRKGKPSRYREADVRAWLAAREAAAKSSDLVDVAQERARKERAQAALAEQMFQARAKTLLPAEEVERAWSAEQSAIRARLLALPQAYADRLARAVTRKGVAGAEAAIREMVDEALTEFATGASAKKARKRQRAA